MKKIIWCMVSLLLIVGCSSQPKLSDYSNMDNEAIYQAMNKQGLINNDSGHIVGIVYESKDVEWEIKAFLNTSSGATDKIGEIFFTYENEDEYKYGGVYQSDPLSPYTNDMYEFDEEAYAKYLELLTELGMTETQVHDFLVYVGETYSLPEEKWAEEDELLQEYYADKLKVTKAVCTFENEQVNDELAMASSTGVNVDAVLWKTTYFNPTDAIQAMITEQANKYKDILGLEFSIDEQGDYITTELLIKYTQVNQRDLEEVGLITGGEGFSVIISLDESVKGFEADGYTCVTTRE